MRPDRTYLRNHHLCGLLAGIGALGLSLGVWGVVLFCVALAGIWALVLDS